MTDDRRARMRDAIANGVDPARLPGLEATLDRLEAALDEPRAPSITCPFCGRTSWNPHDVAEGWCNVCHGATAHRPPAGFRWVLFETRDPVDRFGRMLEERRLEEGSTYSLHCGDYVYRGDRFVPA